MWDQCRINRPPTRTYDRGSNREVEVEGVQIYPDPTKPGEVGRCRAQVMGVQQSREVPAGEQSVTIRPLAVVVPWHVVAVEPDCVVTLIASQEDPRLNNRRFTVTGVEVSTFATARRLTCLDNLG